MRFQKILLVEDDEETRFMMSEMLDVIGATVDLAADGQECLERLEEEPNKYDAVLLDLHMPRKSGLEALEEIRAHRSDPPRSLHVIALTADTAWHDEAKAKSKGFDRVMPKPVNMTSIRNALI